MESIFFTVLLSLLVKTTAKKTFLLSETFIQRIASDNWWTILDGALFHYAFSPADRVFIAILLIILRSAVQDNLDHVSLSWIYRYSHAVRLETRTEVGVAGNWIARFRKDLSSPSSNFRATRENCLLTLCCMYQQYTCIHHFEARACSWTSMYLIYR